MNERLLTQNSIFQNIDSSHFDAVAQSWEDGPYMFILHVQEVRDQSGRAPEATKATAPWKLQRQSRTHTHTHTP